VAESSAEHGDSGLKRVWTFIIKGGQPCTIDIKGRLGPSCDHTGGTTVWKIVGTDEEAAAVEELFRGPLVGASVQRHTEEENDEMLAERQQRLGGLPD